MGENDFLTASKAFKPYNFTNAREANLEQLHEDDDSDNHDQI